MMNAQQSTSVDRQGRSHLDPSNDIKKHFFGMGRRTFKPQNTNQDQSTDGLNALKLARAYAKRGDMHGAKRNYKKVVNSSTNSEVILEYANFLADIDQNPILAEGFYSQVLHLDPSNQEARSRRQQILPSVDAEDDRRLEDVFVFIDDFRRSTSDQKREAATKKMLEFVRIEHIHHSTTIEGNTLSRQQVRDTLDGRPVTSARGSKDCDEVLGLAQALDYIDRHVSRVEDITLEWLRGTWDAVTGKRRAGRLRRCDVYITGVPFVPIEWRLVESEMTAFVEWLHTEAVSPTMDRLEFAILAHYRIAYIHPFVDGNGRMARLVMSLILSRYSLPPIIIYAEDKQTYYGTMRLADAGNLRPFVRFCIDQLQKFYKEVKVRETDEEILDAELGVADNLNPE